MYRVEPRLSTCRSRVPPPRCWCKTCETMQGESEAHLSLEIVSQPFLPRAWQFPFLQPHLTCTSTSSSYNNLGKIAQWHRSSTFYRLLQIGVLLEGRTAYSRFTMGPNGRKGCSKMHIQNCGTGKRLAAKQKHVLTLRQYAF